MEEKEADYKKYWEALRSELERVSTEEIEEINSIYAAEGSKVISKINDIWIRAQEKRWIIEVMDEIEARG
jgi:hypothetical protein